ncbi:MAG: endonuclease/exonuclease/phosphatase family protein [Flavobacteriales bacterium]|jgi:endonuclease/exonuclease/phosphatase family metal-dependent hydrolase|nr:endonuclease/exonuclease/phosphatase family protein [Flavobacteriales bacterium]
MKKRFRAFALFLLKMFYLFVLVAFLIKYIPLEYSGSFSLLHFVFPTVLVGVFLLLLIKLIFKVKWLWWDYIALLFLCWNVSQYYQFNSWELPNKDEKVFSIMTFNAKSLLYKKKHREDDNHDQIRDFVLKEKPDIVCLQETYWRDWNFGYPYAGKSGSSYVILSKFPVIKQGIVPIKDGRLKRYHFADIKIQKDTFRVYNVHLSSYRFSQKDYDLLNETQNIEESEIKERSWSMLRKLNRGILKRRKQLLKLKNHIKKSPYPTFIIGDFNDISHSNTYQQLSENLKDSYLDAGKGLGSTFHGLSVPLRIDYILYPDHFSCIKHEILDQKLSDHFAIKASFTTMNKIK